MSGARGLAGWRRLRPLACSSVVSSLFVLLACQRTVYSARFTDPKNPDRTVKTGITAAREGRGQRGGASGSGSIPAGQSLKKLDLSAPFLKCHLQDGGLLLLEHWKLDADAKVVKGIGIHYSPHRQPVARGGLSVPLEQVVLLETNRPEKLTRKGLVAMGVTTGASAALTALCLSSPKTCFGSCPTFYGFDGTRFSLMAEGFSSSIARVLESTDVDALVGARRDADGFRLWLTNEAPETHVIRQVRVRAAERPVGGAVYRSGEHFYGVGAPVAPSRCSSANGDCLRQVLEADELEHLARTDGIDLATRHSIEFEFDEVPAGPLGLVIGARNGLLSSFLLYQAYAFMGERAGDYIAELERSEGSIVETARSIDAVLGDLEVQLPAADGSFVRVGAFGEVGPIAREVQLVPLPEAARHRPLRVRLNEARGNYKLDHVALVPILGRITPETLEVVRVEDERGGAPDALSLLRDPSRTLVTQPGDAYLLHFERPQCDDCQFFLESRGYYYEWARDVWFAEQDEDALIDMLSDPRAAMRRLAPAYAEVEADVERLFFDSRVRTRMRPPTGRR